MKIDSRLKNADIRPALDRFLELAQRKVANLEKRWDFSRGSPVVTRRGHYETRGWTEWTQGFQFGCQLLVFDATDDRCFLDMARRNIVERMAPHLSHTGVHDHGFNNVSPYG
ncbi:glycosyl hydrolase, partial [bacterium]|nr:glycosyl hydrolase [bacterium]